MRMVDGQGDVAEVEWRLQGFLGGTPFTARLAETLTLNLVTGQVIEHASRWSMEQGGPVASLRFFVTRLAWSARQAAAEAGQASDRVLQSLTSVDEDDQRDTVMRNPDDPTKFFQQQDTFYQDAVAFVLFLAVMYAVFQGWNAVFQL